MRLTAMIHTVTTIAAGGCVEFELRVIHLKNKIQSVKHMRIIKGVYYFKLSLHIYKRLRTTRKT